MTVTHSREDSFSRLTAHSKCSMCKGEVVPPCIEWNDMIMCSSCCRRHQRGLTADMVQLNAIAALQELGYHDVTLVRTSLKTNKAVETIVFTNRDSDETKTRVTHLRKGD